MSDDQPTPPENPFESAGENGTSTTIENGDGLPQGTPGVAAKAGKTYVVLGVVGLVVVLLLYSILGGEDKKVVKDEPNKVAVTPKPPDPPPLPEKDPVDTAKPPGLTPLPPIPDPVAPQDVIQTLSPAPPIDQKADAAAKAQQIARLRSPIMLKDGGGITDALNSSPNPASAQQGDSNARFASQAAGTKAATVVATRIENLRRTIAQGRIIQATMESALNTDLQAPIRAIVSIDTYGEAGTTPLIPKGSRLIGNYNSKLESGQTRVFVVWTRVIRPDGVDIEFGSGPESLLVDAIGQAGVSGQLDSKFQEIFARSLVSSVMNIATAIGSDKITGGTTTTTTSPEGGSQTSGDSATTATTNALNRLGATTDSFLQKFLQVPPTILVDQGTKVNVFVNKDLVFPDDMAGVSIIQ